VARGQTDGARFSGLPAEWRTLVYFPFQLRFRFPDLAAWAVAAWLALLLALPIAVMAVWRTAADYHKDLCIAANSYKGR